MINSGKHLILTGIPGTGKTMLAKDICKSIKNNNFSDSYILTTATSDWSTFDTIGGLMPDKTGNLEFVEGIFLKAIRENKCLIIDEINRADIDKSFGQLFTVLSNQNVELNYKINNKPIKITVTDNVKSCYDSETATYYVGKNWRIIATMNTYDKNSLFDLSYAFMRRFAFITVNNPTYDKLEKLLKIKSKNLDEKYQNQIIDLLKLNQYRKIGFAIFEDIINYVKYRVEFNQEFIMEEVVISFIIPQFEGLDNDTLNEISNYLVKDMKLDKTIITEKIKEISGLLF
ncbi:MAG: AAA family ATPase [Methanobacteriaceae archaeon]|nr:AAA family ATPase [Methanobacteriaceae archaeon]